MNELKYNGEQYIDLTTCDGIRSALGDSMKMGYSPLVFISSPFAGDVETNVHNACGYCQFAVDQHCMWLLRVPFYLHRYMILPRGDNREVSQLLHKTHQHIRFIHMKQIISCLLCCLIFILPVVAFAASLDKAFAELQVEYPSGSLWQEEKYGGTECYAFAREILNRLYGSFPDHIASTKHGRLSNGFIAFKPDDTSPDRARAIINELRPGDYIRFSLQSAFSSHSAVVLEVQEDTIRFVDANNVAKDAVSWSSTFSKSMLAENLEGVYRYLDDTPIPNSVLGILGFVTITYDRAVNLRAGSSGRDELVGVAKPGDKFICIGTAENGWYHILTSSGQEAFVSYKITTLQQSDPEESIVVTWLKR